MRVIRDTKEKEGKGWFFDGHIREKMKTGDYTLQGIEDKFCIERKGSVGEFAQNINQPRFEREFERMEKFAHPFVVLEFDLADIISFPYNSGIPQHLWGKIRVKPYYILKRFLELQVKYKAHFILAGRHGEEVASSLFKRMEELYG